MTGALWYPPANRTAQNFDADPRWHRGPLLRDGARAKLLLHTTEGWGTGWPAYGDGASAPHLTAQPDYGRQRIVWRQHFAFDRYARALRTDGRRINDGGPIQVELCGTSGWASPLNPSAPYHVDPLVPTMPDWYWRDLGALLAWLHTEHDVQLVLVPGGFVPWNRSARMSYDTWLAFDGLIGHQHAPANDHTDPGAIPGARIIEHARAILNKEAPPVTTPIHTPTDVADLERTLRAEGWHIYDGPSFVAAGHCVRGGKHGHLWKKDAAGKVVDWSMHYVDAFGGITGKHIGGAVDVGKDIDKDTPISTWEKARLDDLARRLMRDGWHVIWGVTNHFDHLHVDYNTRQPNEVVFQGPNEGYTVEHIERVQRMLTSAGWKVGDVDGLLGTNTRAAVKDFQATFGLVVDGLPGDNTTAMLVRVTTANGVYTVDHILWVQTALRTLGYYTGPLDGIREEGTIAAVKRFQTFADLDVDGWPGPVTTTAIKTALNPPTPPVVKPPELTLDQRVEAFRVAGPDAPATAVALSRWVAPSGTGVLLVASGSPDHPGAVHAVARRDDVDVLVVRRDDDTLRTTVRDRIAEVKPAWVRAVGGPGAVQSTVVRDAFAAAGIRLP